MARFRVKPSRAASAMGFAVGLAFVCFGLFVVIPTFGSFGILWTFIAAAIAVFNGINTFSKAGIVGPEIIVDGETPRSDQPKSFDERLRQLDQMRKEGILAEDEYQWKRDEVLREKW